MLQKNLNLYLENSVKGFLCIEMERAALKIFADDWSCYGKDRMAEDTVVEVMRRKYGMKKETEIKVRREGKEVRV
jgi:hypothetical protein